MKDKELDLLSEYIESIDTLMDCAQFHTAMLLVVAGLELLKNKYLQLQEEVKKGKRKNTDRINLTDFTFNDRRIKFLERSVNVITKELNNNETLKDTDIEKIKSTVEELNLLYSQIHSITKRLNAYFDYQGFINKLFEPIIAKLKAVFSNKLVQASLLAIFIVLAWVSTRFILMVYFPSAPSELFYSARKTNNTYVSGWYEPYRYKKNIFRWSYAKEAEINITVPAAAANSAKELKLFVNDVLISPAYLSAQRVGIIINEAQIATLNMNGLGIYSVRLSPTVLRAENLAIKFIFPDALSPEKLKLFHDPNNLAIAITGIGLDPVDSASLYKIGQKITFGEYGNANYYLTYGWDQPWKGQRWAMNHSSGLKMRLAKPVKSDLLATLDLKWMLIKPPQVPEQILNFYVNGTFVHTEKRKQPGKFYFKIPKEILTSNIIDIRMDCPNANSSAKLGLNNNDKTISVAIKSLRITKQR